MELRTSGDYFPTQHFLVGFYEKNDSVCRKVKSEFLKILNTAL
jgi:hypothetical protein